MWQWSAIGGYYYKMYEGRIKVNRRASLRCLLLSTIPVLYPQFPMPSDLSVTTQSHVWPSVSAFPFKYSLASSLFVNDIKGFYNFRGKDLLITQPSYYYITGIDILNNTGMRGEEKDNWLTHVCIELELVCCRPLARCSQRRDTSSAESCISDTRSNTCKGQG